MLSNLILLSVVACVVPDGTPMFHANAATVTVAVTPFSATATPGQTVQFAAQVSGTTNTAVTWSVNQTAGGNATVGTISSLGVYTAPVSIPATTLVKVGAASVQDPTQSASVLLTLQPPPLSIAPASVNLLAMQTQQFTIGGAVNGSAAVTWAVNGIAGGNSTVGTVSASGLYAAPAAVAATTAVTVRATSSVDTTKSVQAAVSLRAPVAVSVTPATASLIVGQTQQLTASITGGTTQLGVAWSVNGVAGGNTTVGTVSSAGLYKAPASVAAAATMTVTARSVEDSTKSASCAITVNPTVTVSVTPSAVSLTAGGAQQFAASVTGVTSGVVWSLSAPIGQISSTGLYTAPALAAAAETVTVIATSVADATKKGQAVVGIAPNSAALNGGLVSYPTAVIAANVAANPGFELGKTNWSDNGFTVDTTVAHSGGASLKVQDPYLIPYTQYAWQDIPLKKGVYRIAGWIKTAGLGATKAGAVRICLGAPATGGGPSLGNGCTSLVTGTTDWARYQQSRIVIAQDTTARLAVGVYGEPDGTAWFDDVELRREQQTLSVFMQYPNYRGFLFDDQSQTATFHIDIDAPDATPLAAYTLLGNVARESDGTVLLSQTFVPQASLSAALDLSALPRNLPYLVTFMLKNPLSGASYTYPAYRIVPLAGASRSSMQMSVDGQNRFLVNGRPRFLLGVYDSGLGYTTLTSSWQTTFTDQRRLFELPIDLYLNYWYGATANNAILPMMDVLQQSNIYTMTNANCSAGSTASAMGSSWLLQSDDATVVQRTSHQGFGGFYAADECLGSLADDTLANAQKMRRLQWGGLVFGTLLPWTYDLPFWRDALDVIATDPYVISGALPASGYYPINKVSDAAAQTRSAVLNSRPFMTTIQFFLATSNSRWPTQAELRSMSYAAIVEGSNGLFYWSLGARALAYVCSTWCTERSTYFDSLKAVMTELRSIDPVLSAPDQPGALAVNSNPNIHTRMKQDGSKRYLIVFNTSGTSQSVNLGFPAPFQSVSVAQTGASVSGAGSSFSDTLAGFDAKVYVIQ